ncbi:MAG: flavodoxin family protein, partial [Methanogenium sp.]|nr:flavodoxin family protein [Methanogenium sp.]
MPTCIIYHSETGNTKKVAKIVATATGADLIEVKTVSHYSMMAMYTTGINKARKGEPDEIEPSEIDVSAYDLIVVGTPVWAFRPTPAINAAVSALSGCEGKRAVVFETNAGIPKNTLEVLSKQLTERGLSIAGTFGISDKEINNKEKIGVLIELVNSLKK